MQRQTNLSEILGEATMLHPEGNQIDEKSKAEKLKIQQQRKDAINSWQGMSLTKALISELKKQVETLDTEIDNLALGADDSQSHLLKSKLVQRATINKTIKLCNSTYLVELTFSNTSHERK